MTNCFVCGKEKKNVKYMSIATCIISTSKKPIITVLHQLGKFIKNGVKIPSDGCLCKTCLIEIAQYDKYLTELLKVQRRLTRMIEKSQLGKSQDGPIKSKNIEIIKEEFNDVIFDEIQELLPSKGLIKSKEGALSNLDEAFKEEEIFIDDDVSEEQNEELIREDQLEFSPTDIHSKGEKEEDDVKLPGSKKVTCTQCTKSFVHAARLEYHVMKAHKPQHQCTCTVCGLTLRDEEYLDLHMNLHEGKTEKECRYCLKQYTRKINVIRHMQMHWDKKKFQCEKCGLRFSQTTVLYNHKLQHEAEEVPLICEICNQSFKTKRTYKGHMMTHREDRPRFSCAYCSKTFVEKYTLKVHQRTHESDSSMKAISENVKQKVVTPVVEEMSKLFTCIICGYSFNNRDHYNQHMEIQHDVILNHKEF